MNRITPPRQRPAPARRAQLGAAIVEFALVAMIFFTLLIGIMEFGRWLFTLNAANEATRLGARLAVVCSIADKSAIQDRMHQIAGGIPAGNMDIKYLDKDGNTTGDESNCKTVTVSLNGATFSPLIPFMGSNYPIPAFTTSLSRELMNSTNNPVCP